MKENQHSVTNKHTHTHLTLCPHPHTHNSVPTNTHVQIPIFIKRTLHLKIIFIVGYKLVQIIVLFRSANFTFKAICLTRFSWHSEIQLKHKSTQRAAGKVEEEAKDQHFILAASGLEFKYSFPTRHSYQQERRRLHAESSSLSSTRQRVRENERRK